MTVKNASTFAPSLNSTASAIVNFTAGNGGVDLAMGYDQSALNAWWMQTRNNGANGFCYPLALNPLGGNVGIGTTNPGDKLVISDGGANAISIRAGETAGLGFNRAVTGGGIYNTSISAWQFSARDSMFTLEGYNGAFSNPWTVLKNGNIGIGTTTPMQKLSVVGGTFNVGSDGDYYGAWLSGGQSVDSYLGLGTWYSQAGYIKWFNAARRLAIYTTSSGEPVTLQENGGNVGIGTTSPGEKLSVNGRIRAKEVIVETTGWSDYVFADSYKLQSLSEVEQHIKTEKRLPGVPSAQEIAANGVSVGDMQAILLAKIEELTLQQIAQEKSLNSLQNEVFYLKAQNERLKATKP
ncbi:MAG: hypothetical protein QM715_08310 [Nibricoccus sp.]